MLKAKRWMWSACFFALSRFCVISEEAVELPLAEETAATENRTAAQILEVCTRIIPKEPLLLKGTLTVRRQRGTVLSENPFHLLMDWGANPPSAECLLFDLQGTSVVERAMLSRPKGAPARIRLYSGAAMTPAPAPAFTSRIRGTDMTWLDLTLDFLWWSAVRFDDPARGQSHNGRDCHILLVSPPDSIPGCSAVRIWVDKQLCCIMQAEQLDPQGEPVRKMWVQRVKKMDDRWMIKEMEIETLNSGHRTRLSVESAEKP